MTQPTSDRPSARGQFGRDRAANIRAETAQQAQAALTVAENAVDAEDCRELLFMLGLQDVRDSREREPSGTHQEFARGLAGYVRAVAQAVAAPPEGATSEVSDTATAYVALTQQWPGRPGQDLMLVWSEHEGWGVAVETRPSEPSLVVANLRGADLVPSPYAVAAFVADVLAGRVAGQQGSQTSFPETRSRRELAERLVHYARA
jgi:Family of unknown function (DUF6292)